MDAMVRVTRPVAKRERHNYLGRNVMTGEKFFEFDGATYGSCDEVNGIVLSERGSDIYPFFEFPRDAVERIG